MAGKIAKIAGQDYCSVEEPNDSNDLDLPGGLKIIEAAGGPQENAKK